MTEGMSLDEFRLSTSLAAWQRGIEAEVSGDLEAAYVDLRTACDLEPGNRAARRRLGMVCLMSGRHDEALGAFYVLCAQDRESSESWTLAAFALCAMGEVKEAMRAYRISLGCPERDAAQYLNLGSLFLSRGLFGEAEEVLWEAVQLWPDYPGGYFKLGMARAGLGDDYGAISSFKRASELNPAWVDAWLRLGEACLRVGCMDEAFDAYSEAVELCPASVEARERLVVVCRGLGHVALAEVHQSVLRLLLPAAGERVRFRGAAV